MHLHKQYTCSLMTTLPQGVVASVCYRNSLGKRCNHAYSVIANIISDSAFEFTPQDTDKMSQFRLGHVSRCQLCDLIFLGLCLSACPAKSYFQCWSGWSALSHFQERGCECTSKILTCLKNCHGQIFFFFFLIEPPHFFPIDSVVIKNCLCFFEDNEKRTPLHAAAYLGDAEIIELLILSGKCTWNIHHDEINSLKHLVSSPFDSRCFQLWLWCIVIQLFMNLLMLWLWCRGEGECQRQQMADSPSPRSGILQWGTTITEPYDNLYT